LHRGATDFRRLIEFIDGNDGGPGVPATKAAPEEVVAAIAMRVIA